MVYKAAEFLIIRLEASTETAEMIGAGVYGKKFLIIRLEASTETSLA